MGCYAYEAVAVSLRISNKNPLGVSNTHQYNELEHDGLWEEVNIWQSKPELKYFSTKCDMSCMNNGRAVIRYVNGSHGREKS